MLVIFSTNGEAAIYSGADPDAVDGSFKLVGVYRFDSPMSPGCVVNYGGELYVLIGTGLVPMSTLLKAEEDNLGTSDQNIMQEFSDVSKTFRDAYGWSVIVNSQTNHAICNLPIGSGKYEQLVRFMPNPIWSKWVNVPSRCWAWLDNHAYFGSENGVIYRTGREYLNDNSAAIDVDVRFAWSQLQERQQEAVQADPALHDVGQHSAAVRRCRSGLRHHHPDQQARCPRRQPGRKLEYRDLGCRWLGGRCGAAAEMAGRDRARAGRRAAHPRQLQRLDVLDHGRGHHLRRRGLDVKVFFGDLPPDAQAMLTRHLRIDFSPCDFKAPRWFSAWARNDAGEITGIFAIEFPFWFEGKVTILVLDPRCMSRRVLRAIFTAAFAQAKRLTAEVEPDNRRALRQVQRLGFSLRRLSPARARR